MAWTNLSFAYGSVLTSTKMTQMYDNFAYGTGSTNPTFLAPALGTPASGDLSACTSNTEAVGTNNTQLATTAYVMAAEFVNNDIGNGGVGCIEWLHHVNGYATINDGATVAGGQLATITVDTGGNEIDGPVRAGTWRNISGRAIETGSRGVTADVIGTLQRIS